MGQFWEEGCNTCTCTDMEDTVMGLRVAQCSQKSCEDSCQPVSEAQGLGAAWNHWVRKRGRDVGVGREGRKEEILFIFLPIYLY